MLFKLTSSNAELIPGSSSHTNLIVSIMSMPLSCLSCPWPICKGQENVTTSDDPAGDRNTKSLTCGVAIIYSAYGAAPQQFDRYSILYKYNIDRSPLMPSDLSKR